VRLRQQQDREYRESAEADLRAEEAHRAEQARILAEQQEAQRREEAERAAEGERRRAHDAKIRALREAFEATPEPAATAGAEVSTVRFQLPTGSKLSRRFMKSDPVQVCMNRMFYCGFSLSVVF
jgi:septal ring factor EnvC (AmiA/AmiB activator)